jgi:DNA-directed RNA polymerase specialized sigma24 family protein
MGTATPAERQLLHRLATGDPAVNADIINTLLTPTIRALERIRTIASLTRDDPDLLHDGATDAILDFLENWRRYDPERASLATYIRMAAHRDALNALSMRSRRRRTGEAYEADVRFSSPAGNPYAEGQSRAEIAFLDDEIWDRVREIVTDPAERAFVRLMLEGERSREVYAEILGIPEDVPIAQRNAMVDRMRKKLRTRLQRAGRGRLLGTSQKGRTEGRPA